CTSASSGSRVRTAPWNSFAARYSSGGASAASSSASGASPALIGGDRAPSRPRSASPPPGFHHLDEAAEEIARVVRAGRRLRMILHREGGLTLDRQALDGAIVQVHVCHLGAVAERVHVDHEAVILRRDLDLAGGEVLHRLVAAVMPELELAR